MIDERIDLPDFPGLVSNTRSILWKTQELMLCEFLFKFNEVLCGVEHVEYAFGPASVCIRLDPKFLANCRRFLNARKEFCTCVVFSRLLMEAFQ